MTWGTAKQVSEKYAIPISTVYYYAKIGALPSKSIAGRVKYPIDAIDSNFNRSLRGNGNARVW